MRMKSVYIHPLQAAVLFPYNQYEFIIKSKLYSSQQHSHFIGFTTSIDSHKLTHSIQRVDGVSQYGTLLRIQHQHPISRQSQTEKSNESQVKYTGLLFARFKIVSLKRQSEGIKADIQICSDDIPKHLQLSAEIKNLVLNLRKHIKKYYEVSPNTHKEILDSQTSINKIVYKAINALSLPPQDKLSFLQIQDLHNKLSTLMNHLTNSIQKRMNSKHQSKEEQGKQKQKQKQKTQAEFINNSNKWIIPKSTPALLQRIQKANLPQYVRAHLQKQYRNRGQDMDRGVAEKYIETLLQIPWLDSTDDIKDLSLAQKVLEESHTGLKEVKQRILQYLAVKFRNGNSKGNIICLHGPPGVGKTSIAKSIAKALGRSYTRISLGGMSDESELRGHRRTYVAAMPGQIVKALIKSKSNNPLILLDQIQKLGKSHKGDPQHALLQILDPSQNSSFVDHYVGLPIDLSKVIFICTANSLQLSSPLLNRLELIHIPGYSRAQKFLIAKSNIIPQQAKDNGVEGLLQFEQQGIKEAIKHSNELGIRELQRNIAKICRKVARKGNKQVITKEKVEQYLGEQARKELEGGIGIVNGMACTEIGGKLISVEAIQYGSQRQRIEVTGHLGDVMKESVQIALSWIKANLQGVILPNNMLSNADRRKILEETSIHIHFPEGATKKDGPSAGIALATCIASLILKKAPKANLAMTGEITLSGKVLGVGGIRQKCMAAIYSGIKHIIIPEANLQDIEKIDQQVRRDIEFHGVRQLKQVLAIAFPRNLESFRPNL